MNTPEVIVKEFNAMLIANRKVADAFHIMNFNSRTPNSDELLRAIKMLESARHISYSPFLKLRSTRLIRICTEKMAGVKDYTHMGIGYYAGGSEITKKQYVDKMNKTTAKRRKGKV